MTAHNPLGVHYFPGLVAEFNTPELIGALETISYRQVPFWLGDFSFKMVRRTVMGDCLAACLRSFHPLIQTQIKKLASFSMPTQHFNTVFIQRYEPGQNVKAHCDPKNNTGQTIIGLYGNDWVTDFGVYEKGELRFTTQHPGDVTVLPCTINGVQGPKHKMQWRSGDGIRYAIILNTIEG